MAALEVDIRREHPTPLSIQLTCEPGEVVALVGPSGSGKSTTLKTIAGLQDGAQGRIQVAGQDWLNTQSHVDLPAHRRRTGMVFQSYALFPHMTALRNVMAAVDGHEATKRESALAWLSQMRMKGLEDRKPAQLSGGQQQRVALARALARSPDVLLLDEPFSAVDQMTRERLYEELADLRTRLSVPTIFVTHSILEAQMLADRMVVIHRGRTLQTGTPEDVFRRPVEPDVARLMGHKNVFHATVVRQVPGGCAIDWNGLELVAGTQRMTGEVAFVAPSTEVRIVEPDEQRSNAVDAQVEALTSLGEQVVLRARLRNSALVTVTAAAHLVRKRGLQVHGPVRLAFQPDAVHLMQR